MNRIRQARRDARQLFRLCLVDGMLDETRLRQVLDLVSGSRNRNRLNVLAQMRRLVQLDKVRHTATVESATPLAADMRDKVLAGLSRTYGPGLVIAFSENPALIGGMRIQVATDLYDGSVRARLAALEAQFSSTNGMR